MKINQISKPHFYNKNPPINMHNFVENKFVGGDSAKNISFGVVPYADKITEDLLRKEASVLLNSIKNEMKNAKLFDSKRTFTACEDNCESNLAKLFSAQFTKYTNIEKSLQIVYESFKAYFQKVGKNKQIEKHYDSLSNFFNGFLDSETTIKKTGLKLEAANIKTNLQNDINFAKKFNAEKAEEMIISDYQYNLKNETKIFLGQAFAPKEHTYKAALRAVRFLSENEGKAKYIKKSDYEKIIMFLDKYQKFDFENTVAKSNKKFFSPLLTPELKAAPAVKKAEEKVSETLSSNRHAIIDEYESKSKARKDFYETVKNRKRTPEELEQDAKLRGEMKEVLARGRKEHQSFIRLKQESDFSKDPIKNKEEKFEYVTKQVLGRMGFSEESALDGLDMFEKFGVRANYPNETNNTYRLLSEKVMFHPKEDLSDRLLNKFLEVFEKIAVKDETKYKDNEILSEVLVHYTDNLHNVKEETVLRGIKLLKKLTNQKDDVKRLKYTLIEASDAQYKDSQKIKEAIADLEEAVKDCPLYFRLPNK